MDGGRALDRGRHGGRPRAGAGGAGRGADMSGKNGKTKFIFVTGGVVSSLGKGVASASIGALLEARGLKVTLVKKIGRASCRERVYIWEVVVAAERKRELSKGGTCTKRK